MSNHKPAFFGLFLALFVFFPMATPSGSVHAQQSSSYYATPRINGLDVAQVQRLVAGTELNFTLYGTPGGIAIISIPGATGRLLLEEVETGLYMGAYTIKTTDRIAADSRVTVNLRLGNQVASAVLDEPLIAVAAEKSARSKIDRTGNHPRIDRFDVIPNQLTAGSDLLFSLHGAPGGRAIIRIAGVAGRVFLEESRNGVYEGLYTIKTRDRIAPDSKVTAVLRLGDQRSSAVLGKSLLAASGTRQDNRRAARSCANCGVIETINEIEVKGEGNYLGMIAGGLAGALLGRQVGGGTGKTVATVAGAAGGVYVGNEVEKRVKSTKHYEVIVRLENGGTQTITYAEQPTFPVGTRVKVANGVLTVVQ